MDTPRTIGRYRIVRWLAAGAMGEVYEGHDPVIDRPIALKLLRRDLVGRAESAGWLERFRREARAAGRRLHPNIVAILDFGEEGGAPFLAMEYVDGESLADLLKRAGPLPLGEARSIIAQVLDALGFAHHNGVIHRDIKPSNILIRKDGHVKLADFGVAHVEASDLTLDGDVLGTPSYMAPEQLSGAAVDHRADLFAAGVVLYEMLAGRKPFQGRSIADTILNVREHEPAKLSQLDPTIPPSLDDVVARALSHASADRYADAAEFSQAIAGAIGPAPPPAALRSEDATVVIAPHPATAPAPDVPPPATADPEALANVERDLAVFLGPMARLVVRRAASASGNLHLFYEQLAQHIDNDSDRTAFINKGRARASVSGAATGVRAPPSLGPAPARIEIAPDALGRIEAGLMQYVGPIARVLIRQQASQSASLADLCQRLAAYIPDENDRKRFLDAATRNGGGKR